MSGVSVLVNGERIEAENYLRFHRRRIELTLDAVRKLGARQIVELGGHPWVMTSIFHEAGLKIAATVSAEEVTAWPDDIAVTRRQYKMKTMSGQEMSFLNYSTNIERKRFSIEERPDTAIACEIIEHLIRSPHVMLLNINAWLPLGGKLLLTTPNGTQFSNPFRRKSSRPAYRYNVYARHNGALTRNQLVDLVSLCGFEVEEAGFWNVYERAGASRLYSALAKLPLPYFREKFHRTIFLLATKARDVTELSRLPKCYEPNTQWEFIRPQ